MKYQTLNNSQTVKDKKYILLPILALVIILISFVYSVSLQSSLNFVTEIRNSIFHLLEVSLPTLLVIFFAAPLYLLFLVSIKNYINLLFFGLAFLLLNIFLIFALYNGFFLYLAAGLVLVVSVFTYLEKEQFELFSTSVYISLSFIQKRYCRFIRTLSIPLVFVTFFLSVFLYLQTVFLDLLTKKDIFQLTTSLVQNPTPLLNNTNQVVVTAMLFFSYLSFLYLSFLSGHMAYFYGAAYVHYFGKYFSFENAKMKTEKQTMNAQHLQQLDEFLKSATTKIRFVVSQTEESLYFYHFGSLCKGAYMIPISLVFNAALTESVYRLHLTKKEPEHWYDKFVLSILPCTKTTLVYTKKAYLSSVRNKTNFNESAVHSMKEFFRKNGGNLFFSNIANFGFFLIGIFITILVTIGPVYLEFLSNQSEFKSVNVTLGINTFLTAFSFIKIVHYLVVGAVEFLMYLSLVENEKFRFFVKNIKS